MFVYIRMYMCAFVRVCAYYMCACMPACAYVQGRNSGILEKGGGGGGGGSWSVFKLTKKTSEGAVVQGPKKAGPL